MSDGDKFPYSGNFAYSQFGGDRSSFVQNIVGEQSANVGADLQRVGPLIRQLLDVVAEHADRIERPEHARRDAEEILDEVARPEEKRDTGRIADAFRRLRARLQPVAEFAEPLGRIAEALSAIIPG